MEERLQLGNEEDPAIVLGSDSGDFTKKLEEEMGRSGRDLGVKFSRSGDGMDWGGGNRGVQLSALRTSRMVVVLAKIRALEAV